jgi:hypothetical protein
MLTRACTPGKIDNTRYSDASVARKGCWRAATMMVWYKEHRSALWLVVGAVLAAAITAFVVVAPTPPFPPKGYGKDLPPAKLLADFYSYSTTEEVRGRVRALGLQWDVVKVGAPPTQEDHLYVAKVPNFSHLEVSGDLWFYFLRDRLMRVRFVTPDPATYWDRLVQTERLRVKASGNQQRIVKAKAGNEVEVWLNMYPEGRYVGWGDERLVREARYRYD